MRRTRGETTSESLQWLGLPSSSHLQSQFALLSALRSCYLVQNPENSTTDSWFCKIGLCRQETRSLRLSWPSRLREGCAGKMSTLSVEGRNLAPFVPDPHAGSWRGASGERESTHSYQLCPSVLETCGRVAPLGLTRFGAQSNRSIQMDLEHAIQPGEFEDHHGLLVQTGQLDGATSLSGSPETGH